MFHCTECNTEFKTATNFRRHRIRIHHPTKKEHKCTVRDCHKLFTTRYELTLHQRTVHTGHKPFSCPLCDRKYTSGARLNDHVAGHTGEKPFTCPVAACGKLFATKTRLTMHSRTHSEEKPHSCSRCGKSFRTKSGLAVHGSSHSSDKPFRCDCGAKFAHQTGLQTHKKYMHGSKPKFECATCHKSFTSKPYLRKHQFIHFPAEKGQLVCEVAECGQSFAKPSQLCRHNRTKHRQPETHTCTYCARAFSEKENLSRHIRTHTGEKMYSCDECRAGFISHTNFRRHLRTHTGERPYKCRFCEQAFLTAAELGKHENSKHTGARQYRSGFGDCARVYLLSTSLQAHIKFKHSQEKPGNLACNLCPRKFKSRFGLTGHLKTHTGEKPYSCPFPPCTARYAWENLLRAHINAVHVHAANRKYYECGICKKKLTTPAGLRSHTAHAHSDSRNFNCSYCDAKFKSQSNLTDHVRTHTGEKPFQCPNCGAAFRRKLQLKRHRDVHIRAVNPLGSIG